MGENLQKKGEFSVRSSLLRTLVNIQGRDGGKVKLYFLIRTPKKKKTRLSCGGLKAAVWREGILGFTLLII